MSKVVVLSVFIAILSLTTVGFAGLFAWQYIDKPDTNSTGDDPSKTNASTSCPYYPTPQEIDFTKHEEFAQLFKWIDTYLSSTVNETNRPSVAANLVYMDKVIWSGYYGRVNKSADVKPNENTIYRIGSISKVFPVLFLFKLWEDGKLNLYEPVTKYAPDFSIGRPLGTNSEINLIDIASQLSGLAGSLPIDPLAAHSAIVFNGTLEDALGILQSQILAAEPRSRCIYSNLAYALLGDILARNFTTDRDFTKWAKENVVDVLGMPNTGFSYTDEVKSKMAIGYLPNGSPAPIYDLLWYGPAGNYYSTVADLAKFSMSFMETSKTILKHETLTEMLRTRKTCGNDYFVNITGTPWEMKKVYENLVVSKYGGIEGYSSAMSMVPDLKLSLNVLNSGARVVDEVGNVLQKVIPVFRDVLRSMEQKITPTPNPEKYVGLFSYFNLQNQNITADSKRVLRMTNAQQPPQYNTTGLSYVSDDVFQLVIMGSGFPCVSNLDIQNGAFLHFKNYSNDRYHEFDMPEIYVYGFKRV